MDSAELAARVVPDTPVVAKAGLGAAALMCLWGTLSSSSMFGPGIRDAAGGIFGAHATVLAPDSRAFIIWLLVYIGAFGHTVRVWVPDPLAHARRRLIIWPATITLLLNALWMFAAMRGLVWATLPVMLVQLFFLFRCMEAIRAVPAHDVSALVLIDGTYGLYLGWLLVATPANVASIALAAGIPPTGAWAEGLALALLVAATVAAVWSLIRYRGNVAIPLAFCWGLVWLVRARFHGGPLSVPVGVTAVVAAGLVAAVFGVLLGRFGVLLRDRATGRLVGVTSLDGR